jgi:hypothetical protein
MATLIPHLDPMDIKNDGERAVYTAAARLPADYTVLYSWHFPDRETLMDETLSREADFIIVHPAYGFIVLEVKQGSVGFIDGQWMEYKGKDYTPMHDNPVEQAKRAMYAVLRLYQQETGQHDFPLHIAYGVVFPDSSRLDGILPVDLREGNLILSDALDNLEPFLLKAFGMKKQLRPDVADLLVNRILAPSFKIYSKLEDQIVQFSREAQRVLTDEQERILEETGLDNRKVFLGSAGSGKTFVAMEKARQLVRQGKRVFLTCFNRSLAKVQFMPLSAELAGSSGTLVTDSFHDWLESLLERNGVSPQPHAKPQDLADYYALYLPSQGLDLIVEWTEEEQFDAILVDEGQDFLMDWVSCLEAMLKPNGSFFVFADPNQDLFSRDVEAIQRIPVSKHRLTRNLRNSQPIHEWMRTIVPEIASKGAMRGGLPVKRISWKTPEEERKKIGDEIGRLVSQGLQPRRILILSPHRQENSCLAGLNKIKEWPLVRYSDAVGITGDAVAGITAVADLVKGMVPGTGIAKRNEALEGPRTKTLVKGSGTGNAVRFETIRSFKGLEADVVFLIGIYAGEHCTRPDVYVGGSRARFLLYVFYQEGCELVD